MINFYAIEPGNGMMFGTKWTYADIVEPSRSGDCQYCPVCGNPVSGLRWLPPFRIKLSSSKPNKWGDFVWGAGFPLLVSSRFKDLYESEGLSGIQEFSTPVEVVRMGTLKTGLFPTPPPTYHLVYIPWGGANQDDVASGLTHEHPERIKCSYCRAGFSWRSQARVIIEEGSWDGSDIFKPRNSPVNYLISERFKRVIDTHRLTNIWCIPAEKFGFNDRSKGRWFVNE